MIPKFLSKFEETKRETPASAFRKAAGIFLIATGIAGLFLPLLQGVLLITIGYLVFTNQDWRKVAKKMKSKIKEKEIKRRNYR